jgi:hypothetical protein
MVMQCDSQRTEKPLKVFVVVLPQKKIRAGWVPESAWEKANELVTVRVKGWKEEKIAAIGRRFGRIEYVAFDDRKEATYFLEGLLAAS